MKKTILLIAFVFTTLVVQAQSSEVFSNKKGAINGYDAVAYFTESKAVVGDTKYSTKWKEATWYFSSKENLTAFKANPEKYAPQFGGYCAYGTSQGHKAPTDPEAWTIVDGKLYLNYNKDVKKKWSKNQKELIEQANAEWPKIKDATE
ncbi:YHS domain-containing (seleno)protein [Flavobacterium sp. UBA7682]|uniref:YHS domain-containing (seleno)protein n=1 Tax=Flavobacterium sp. UBA7682 TaxID=1946560 RepID=UPI0025BBDD04|nr:YHS domain-containing (seleno)protein [Flavobacterium sp. UBA7682]